MKLIRKKARAKEVRRRMARMGSKRHLKRLAAPEFWPILRKEKKWVVKPSPGPHPVSRSLPLLVIVRDVLGLAETSREARKIISEGHIMVDKKVRKNYKFPVGFMDVIEIVDTEEYFRVIPVPVKFMSLVPIPKEEAEFKVCRIENKTTVKGGKIQLNLHDGRNILLENVEAENEEESEEEVQKREYRTMSSVKIGLPSGKILDYYPLREGSPVIVIGGRNVGKVAKLVSITPGMRHYRKQVELESFKGERFFTTLDKLMVIGHKEPEITLPEGAV